MFKREALGVRMSNRARRGVVTVSWAAALLFGSGCQTRSESRPEAVATSKAALSGGDAGPASPSIGTFAVYASEAIQLNSNASITGCNVGVENTTGPFLADGSAAELNSEAKIQSTQTLYAASVFLNSGASVGAVDTNALTGNAGATHGTVSSFPAMPALPTAPSATAGTAAVTVNSGASKTLGAGAYGSVTVNANATLSLTGGTYVFSSLTLNSGATLQTSAPAAISVTGAASFNSGASIGPTSASKLTAKALVLYFDSSSAVMVNTGAKVRALLVAPRALVTLNTSSFTGAVAAAQVELNSGATVTCEDSFGSLSLCASVTCTAMDQCHVAGTCNPSTGQCSNPTAANGTSCNDGDACDLNDSCQSGVCTAASHVTCTAPDSCHTAGTCNATTGVCSAPTLNAGSCFIGGACVAAGAANGANTCESCQLAVSTTQYSNVANGTACNDGSLCDSNDSCQAGVCTAGSTVVCTASDSCHVAGTCNPATGQCSNPVAANGTACNDGSLCDLNDSCQAGVCTAGSTVLCIASDPCHVGGICNPVTGTCSNPAAPNGTTCNDGNACTQTDSCQSGTCVGSNPVTCTASDQCHVAGTCNTATGSCSNPAASNGTACNDGNACTQTDSCQSGTCVGSNPVTCTASDQCHVAGTCSATTGSCSNPVASNGTACNDGNACTQTDSCQSGACVGSNPVTCIASDQCHLAGTCNTATGICSDPAAANGTACNDGNGCTQTDSCQSGACAGSNPVTCAAQDDCHVAGQCQASTGTCTNPTAPDGTTCAGANLCNQSYACVGGTCTGSNPIVCTASGQCQVAGSCDPTTGNCSTVSAPDGTSCNDGNSCTTGDACTSGVCAGTLVTCSASDACHAVGLCNPTTGACSNPDAPDGTACNAHNACTTGDSCALGVCEPGMPSSFSGTSACELETCDPVLGIVQHPCSPLDRTVSTTLWGSTSFLYSGATPIQTGVAAGTIGPTTAAVVRGHVYAAPIASGESPVVLPGVTITVLGHPEFGTTLSQGEGSFDMAVNGGQTLRINYARSGYLPAQRTVQTPWQNYVTAGDVVLMPLDPDATPVTLAGPTVIQVARGSTQTDVDGTRTATVMIPPSTEATMTLPGGSTAPLSAMTVRATEYTNKNAMANGNPASTMPGDLPLTSAFTYAVELSADEALAQNATEVTFSQPLPFYVENFLAFPAGTAIPLGYYDKTQGEWVASRSGVVLTILNVAGGSASIDVDGQGQPATTTELSSLSITAGELQQLAALYAVGQSLWRVLIPHFSGWDENLGYGPPPGAGVPKVADPIASGSGGPGSCTQNGSIIGCQDQVLGEVLPVAGTPYSLHYESDRQHGRQRSLVIPLAQPSLPGPVQSIQVEVDVAGRVFTQAFPAQANLPPYGFSWDGNDAYGRAMQGAQPVTVRVGNTYNPDYANPGGGEFGGFGGILITPTLPTRSPLTLWKTWTGTVANGESVGLGTWDSLPEGLGGWTLNVHHAYDIGAGILRFGDGTNLTPNSYPRILQTAYRTQFGAGSVAVAPDGSLYVADGTGVSRVTPDGTAHPFAGTVGNPGGDFFGFSGDGGPATAALLGQPTDIALGPDGSLYIADYSNCRIRRVYPSGIINTVAGSGASFAGGCGGGFSGDGGPATQAVLSHPTGVDVATDGSVYIADQNNRRVRRVAPDGTISTVVFNGAFLSSPPSVPPPTLATSVPAIGLIAKVRVGPDGSLYTVETGGNGGVVRRVTPDGLIGPFAGNLAFGFGGDGGPAVAATFQHPGDAAVAPDGSVYINDGNNCTREVTPDGMIRTAAGVPGNNGRSSGNDVPATAALIGTSSVRVAPDGTLYVGDGAGGRICKVGPPLAGFSDNISGFTFPSTDGTQVYNFDPNGRHLTTVDAFTGATLYSFAYDSAGRLSTVTDVNGDVTHVSRDGSGNLSSIVGPFGETTTFTPDPNGYMASATDPAGLGTQFSYDSGGLMQMMTDPRGGLHQFGYDGLGRLAEDQDPAGGSKVLAETVGNNEFTTTVTTALGQQTTYVTQNGSTGSFGRANTLPTGLQSSLQFGTNYSTATTVPDGTTTSEADGADPRFGMLAPVPSVTTTLPSGLTSIRSTSRAFTLGAGGTLATFTEKTTLNGNAWTRAFSVGPPITWTATSPVGRVTKTTVDPAGRPLQISINATPPVTPLSFAYDSHGRLQQVTQGTRIWTTGYDTNGYANSQTDPLNQTVTTTNDPDGRPLLTTLQDQREVGTSWDGDSNMSSVTLPGALATQPDPTREHQFSYTPVDLTQTYTPPAIATGLLSTTYAYNVDRFLQTITRPDSVVVTHVPDAFERLSQIVYPQGTLAYAYNPSTGLLQSTTTPGGETTTFGFDGFLPKSITWSGPVAGSVTFGYNLDFRVDSQSLNGGPALPFAYDNDDLLTCAGATACPAAGALTITPDPQNGRLSTTAFGNVTDAYAYDTNGLLASYAAAFSGNPVYVETIVSRDANGRIHEKIDALSGTTHDWVYSYDPAGRLTDVTEDGNFESHYAYDGDDNRTSFTNTSGTVNPTYDVQDRLSTYGPASYAYTANGELTSKTVAGQTTSYIYDALGNLLHVGFASALPDGTTTVDYVVDGQNRRVGRKVNGTLVQGWLYQDPLRPVAQLDGSNNVVARFVYGSKTNVPDYMVTSGGTYRILSDHLGSPRLVVDTSSGNVIETINYDEFGSENDALAASLPAGYQRIPFAFAGGLQDPDTGLVRFGARDYDASVGRWTSKDPTRFDGGSMNLYGYVLNDPVDIFDPNGTDVAGWFCQHLGWFCGPQCVEPDCLPGPPPGPSPPPDPVMCMEPSGGCPPCPDPPPDDVHMVPNQHGCPNGHVHYFEYHQGPPPDCICRLVRRVRCL